MGEFELYTGTSEEATSALVLFDIVHKTWLMSKRMRRSGKQVCDVVWGVSTISPSPRAHCLMVARPTPPPGSLSTWSDKVQIKQNLEISHLATSLSLLSLVLGIFLTLSIWQIMILSDHFHMIFCYLVSLDTQLLTSGHSEVLEGHGFPGQLELHIVWVCTTRYSDL